MNRDNAPFSIPPVLYVLINELYSSKCQKVCTVFVEISGHVKKFGVRIFKGEWIADELPDFDEFIYLDTASRECLVYFVNKTQLFLSEFYKEKEALCNS